MESLTISVGYDTPISMLTPRQLFELQQQWADEHKPEEASPPPPQSEEPDVPRYVYSIKELAEVLHYSWRRAKNLAMSGAIDEAKYYWAGRTTYDVPMILDIIRMSNRDTLERRMKAKSRQRTA
jgi:hypothetical protein